MEAILFTLRIRKHISWTTTRDEQNSPWITQRM